MVSLSIAKQIMDYHKILFDNTYDTIISFQKQTEIMTHSFLWQNTPLVENGKNSLNEWFKILNKRNEEYKKIIDDQFQKIENFIIKSPQEEIAASKEKITVPKKHITTSQKKIAQPQKKTPQKKITQPQKKVPQKEIAPPSKKVIKLQENVAILKKPEKPKKIQRKKKKTTN